MIRFLSFWFAPLNHLGHRKDGVGVCYINACDADGKMHEKTPRNSYKTAYREKAPSDVRDMSGSTRSIGRGQIGEPETSATFSPLLLHKFALIGDLSQKTAVQASLTGRSFRRTEYVARCSLLRQLWRRGKGGDGPQRAARAQWLVGDATSDDLCCRVDDCLDNQGNLPCLLSSRYSYRGCVSLSSRTAYGNS